MRRLIGLREKSAVRVARAAALGAFPLRAPAAGSQIVYVNDKSKIYCAKYKPLAPAR